MRFAPVYLLLIAAMPLLSLSCQATQKRISKPRTPARSDQVVPEGFRPLFNGVNLDGWTVRDPANQNWQVVEGVIDCDPHAGPGDRNLWTTQSYRDFELLVDWRLKESLAPSPN